MRITAVILQVLKCVAVYSKLEPMKKKNFILATIAVILSACNLNEPTKAFEGVWEPVLIEGVEVPDLFIISSDSIKVYNFQLEREYYQCHYKVIRRNLIELERCWAENSGRPESFLKAKVPMYIDKQGYLIIEDFDPSIQLQQNYPNYANLKLQRHED